MQQELGHRLGLLLKFALKIAAETNPDRLLTLLAAETRQMLQAERCTVFLVDRRRGELWSKVAQGLRATTIRLKPGQGIAGHVFRTRKTLNIADAYADPRFARRVDRRTGYRTRSVLAMPMLDSRKKTVLGVFEVLNKRSGRFTKADQALLTVLADHASASVENAQLYGDLRQAQRETIFRLALMAEHRDQQDTAAHLERVACYSGLIAEALGWPAEDVETLRLAATLHDIGKVATPDAILLKSEKLPSTELGGIEYRLAWWMEKLKFMREPAKRIREVAQYLEDIRQANRPSSREMSADLASRIRQIGAHRFIDRDGREKPLLSADEVKKLTIMRGNLTPEEWVEIRKHTTQGGLILAQAHSQVMQVAERIAVTHHEQYEGTGYPKRLRGRQIPIEGRIVGLVDVFDALSSRRVYKQRWGLDEVVNYIRGQSGKQFDPMIVRAFLKALPKIRRATERRGMLRGSTRRESLSGAGRTPVPSPRGP